MSNKLKEKIEQPDEGAVLPFKIAYNEMVEHEDCIFFYKYKINENGKMTPIHVLTISKYTKTIYSI